MNVESKPSQALVIGAGIAGIKAALELAESGIKVNVCEISAIIGGALFRMEKWFPDNHCGICKILPVFDRGLPSQYCLRRGLEHPNISFHLGSAVKKVEGEASCFRVLLEQQPEIIDAAICTGCGLCSETCPVFINSSENRKAAYLSNPQSLRKTYIIDREYCTQCGACINICPAGAINFHRQSSIKEIDAGAIILSTGFEEFDPASASQYGYQRYPNVITGFDLEYILNGNSPSAGKLVRPSDGKAPGSVAFIQCVGSRDNKNDFCSSTCCMYAIREASMIREQNRNARIEIFYMDIRSFGKGHQRYTDHARDVLGIKFTRGRVPVIKQDFRTNNLLINSIDASGKIITGNFDMVVLSASQRPSKNFHQLGQILDIDLNKWGFAATGGLSPVATSREGIFACGSASGPREIAESIAGATAAAEMAMKLLQPQKTIAVQPEPSPQTETGTSVFICNCKGQISKFLNIRDLTEYARSLPGVCKVEEYDHLCSEEQSQLMRDALKKSGASSGIIAACSIFRPREMLESIPLNPVNIREELVWPHADPDAVMIKAQKILAMALENIKWRKPQPSTSRRVTQRAVVIGAGLAGLQSAQVIADRGIEVDIIEKSKEPGGNMKQVHSILEGLDPQAYLNDLTETAQKNPIIHLYTSTEVVGVAGYAGNFECIIADNGNNRSNLKAGAIVLATGAGEYKPQEYRYGEIKTIITQRELERMLASGNLLDNINSIVMIQCVGSRDKERPYCSRICCSQALKNALELKDRYPELQITVLYRDMMSYGFKEEFYTSAREKGVLFLRYDLEHKPQVNKKGDRIEIAAFDDALGKELILNPDLLVLSPGIIPGEGNKALAVVLGIELTEDRFFKEVEAKFQPVDSTREGIFICGLANSPMSIPETIIQARAAGHRAAVLLRRNELFPFRAIAEVNERKCTGCELCIPACPYHARIKDSVKRVTLVIEELCQGCGACSAICPNGATTLREFTGKQVFSLLDEAI